MKDQTSSSLMKKNQKEQEYWQHIHDLETRIIDAVMAIEAQYLFEYMEHHESKNSFREYWRLFRKLPEHWAASDFLWNDLDKLREHRNWNREHECLKIAHDLLPSAVPYGSWDREWEEDDRACTSLKEANPETHIQTWGGVFRKLVGDLNHIIYLIDQDNRDKATDIHSELDCIRDQEIAIRKAVEILPIHWLFETMVSGLSSSHDEFMECWNILEQLSPRWEESSSNDNNSATLLNDKKWRKARLTLKMIDRNIHWAFPRGSKHDVEWKNDYRRDPHPMTDPIQPTFGKAWTKMQSDITRLKWYLKSSEMTTKGRNGDREYWRSIHALEARIVDNVPKFPQHLFFEHMVIPGMFRSRDKERYYFMLAWGKLEKLCQKWKDTSDIWNHTENFIKARGWEEDARVLDEVSHGFKGAEPRGFEHDIEWDKILLLPVSRMRKDIRFNIREVHPEYIEARVGSDLDVLTLRRNCIRFYPC